MCTKPTNITYVNTERRHKDKQKDKHDRDKHLNRWKIEKCFNMMEATDLDGHHTTITTTDNHHHICLLNNSVFMTSTDTDLTPERKNNLGCCGLTCSLM